MSPGTQGVLAQVLVLGGLGKRKNEDDEEEEVGREERVEKERETEKREERSG